MKKLQSTSSLKKKKTFCFVLGYSQLWFQCVCPLMPSHNTYHLSWVSLTLDVGYLIMAAPAKHSHCSLPWTRLPLLTLDVG